MQPARLLRFCLGIAASLVFPALGLAEAPVPIYVANVDATALATNRHLSLAALTSGPDSTLARLRGRISEGLRASAKLVLVDPTAGSPPEGMLLLLPTIGHADVIRWRTDLAEGNQLTELRFRLSAEMQLVDPVSGQMVYSDTDYFLSEEWDELGRNLGTPAHDPKRVARFREDPQVPGRLLKFVAGKAQGSLARAEVFQELLERSMAKLGADLLTRFAPRRISAQVAHVLHAERGEFVLNRGRTSGLFDGMKVVAAPDRRVAIITESFAEYAIARMESGPPPERWTGFGAYQMALGSAQSQSLVTVTRILFSPPLLASAAAVFLGTETAPAPLFQRVFAKQVADQLADSGKFRLGFPLCAQGSLSHARQNLNDDFTRGWHRDIDQASALPDYGVTALVSNLTKTRKPVTGGHEDRYEVTASLCLYNWRNGDILSSVKVQGERTIREAELAGVKGLVNESREAEVFNLIRGTLRLGSERLAARCQPASQVVGLVTEVNGATVRLAFPPVQSLHEGLVLQLAQPEGAIHLHTQSVTKTDLHRYRRGGLLSMAEQRPDGWNAKRVAATGLNSSAPQVGDKVFLSGLPERIGIKPFRQLIRIETPTVAAAAADVITPEDLLQLAFAAAADEPRLRLLFDTTSRASLRKFDRERFTSENAFVLERGQEAEAERSDYEQSPSLVAYVNLEKAQATRLLDKSGRRSPEVQMDFKVTLGFTDRQGQERCKPATFTLNRTQPLGLDEPDGPAAARGYLGEILAKLVAFCCEKRLPDLQ